MKRQKENYNFKNPQRIPRFDLQSQTDRGDGRSAHEFIADTNAKKPFGRRSQTERQERASRYAASKNILDLLKTLDANLVDPKSGKTYSFSAISRKSEGELELCSPGYFLTEEKKIPDNYPKYLQIARKKRPLHLFRKDPRSDDDFEFEILVSSKKEGHYEGLGKYVSPAI